MMNTKSTKAKVGEKIGVLRVFSAFKENSINSYPALVEWLIFVNFAENLLQ
ncbi:MAG: hypothetical protein LUC85_11695 [Bacteroidales bacterium]|nr:hypothetical protein [Bacteroidales bacterium]MCD8395463.1 hypothetical protein [Bacteroidales bacterium]